MCFVPLKVHIQVQNLGDNYILVHERVLVNRECRSLSKICSIIAVRSGNLLRNDRISLFVSNKPPLFLKKMAKVLEYDKKYTLTNIWRYATIHRRLSAPNIAE